MKYQDGIIKGTDSYQKTSSLILNLGPGKLPMIRSFLIIKLMGLPVLDSIILLEWNERTADNLINAIKILGWNGAILRRDVKINSIDELKKKPKGGDVYSGEALISEVKKSILTKYAVLLLEPFNRSDNLYSGVTYLSENSPLSYWELVGRGFDTSDIKRGEYLIHQRIEVWNTSDMIEDPVIHQNTLINTSNYRNELKKKKSSYKGLSQGGKYQFTDCLSLSEDVYIPIPYDLFSLVSKYAFLFWREKELFLNKAKDINLSFSFIDEGRRLIFWDFY